MFTSSVSRACGEEDVVIDPVELLGKRMDFQIRIVRCLGAKWLKEDAERGIQMGYHRPGPPPACGPGGGALPSSVKNEFIIKFS